MKKPKLFIEAEDYMDIHNCCQATAQRNLAKIRKECGVPPRRAVPIRIYAKYYNCSVEEVRMHFVKKK